MDNKQAIFLLEDQAFKHDSMASMARTIMPTGDSIIAKQHQTIAEALRYAADRLREMDDAEET